MLSIIEVENLNSTKFQKCGIGRCIYKVRSIDGHMDCLNVDPRSQEVELSTILVEDRNTTNDRDKVTVENEEKLVARPVE